jgi:AcrR family transcriptional regulator
MNGNRSSGRTGRPAKVPGEVPTKQKILDVSIDLFAERGYDRASIRDISKAVGITESAVYRHYENKDAILEAIFDQLVNQVYTPLPPKRVTSEQTSIFRQILEGLPAYILANPHLIKILRILLYEMSPNERVREFMKQEYDIRAAEYTEALLSKEMEAGRIRQCDVRALAVLVNSFRFAWLFQEFIVDYGKQHDLEKLESEMESQIRLFEQLTAP